MEKTRSFGQKCPLLFGVLSCVILAVLIKIIPANNFFQMGLIRYAGAIVAILIMWPSLGFKFLRNTKSGWAYSFKLWKWPLIVTSAIALLIVVYNVILIVNPSLTKSGTVQVTGMDIFIGIISLAFCIIAVGIVEEMAYRRGLFVAAVMQFPKLKNRIMMMALLSSAIFGFAHVVFSLSLETSAIISILLKTLESGIFGFIMCACLIEGKNIWPLATIHFLMDFVLTIPQVLQGETTVQHNYVQTSFDIITLVGYGIIVITILLYLKPLIKSVRFIKEYETINSDKIDELFCINSYEPMK